MSSVERNRLLVVDNSLEYRRSVRDFLELKGYSTAEAGTAKEALEKLELEDFDLVLTGLRLVDDTDIEDMSGLEVSKFAAHCEVPCILVTSFPSGESARMVLRAIGGTPPIVDLILKASGPQALLDSIQRALRHDDAGPTKTIPH
jgi:CheY-like chemotaxis protein